MPKVCWDKWVTQMIKQFFKTYTATKVLVRRTGDYLFHVTNLPLRNMNKYLPDSIRYRHLLP
jgi:hypothetical protein